VAVQATDPAGASATAVVTITVRNLPPTLDATIPSEAVPASEVSVPLSATDAGPGPLVGTIDWGDGSGPVPVELTPTGAPEGVAARVFATASGTAVQGTPTHTYTIAGVFAVVVTVCDPQEACATQTGEITVSEQPPDNRAPRAVLDGPAAVDEGGAIVLSAARSDDPDGDPLVYAWTIDGVPAGTADSVEVRGLRPGPLAVAVTVADGRGGRASASTTVTVANLPPTVTLDGPADEVPLATPVTMAVLATDPGDQALTAALDGGTGATPLELVPVTVTSGVVFSAAPVVSFAEPGDHPVTVTVCDPSGACAAARRTVRVAAPPPPPPSPPNEAPQAVIDSPTTVDEGAPVTVSGERSADPDGDALTYRWRVSGAESGNEPALVLPGRGHGVVEVELIVDDGRGGTTAARAAVTVRNLPPSVRATGEPTVLVGQAWALAVDAADPWSSRLTTRVEWGDGSVTDLSSAVASGHTYQHPGTYVVTVTVCDDADACTQTSTLVSATAPVPAAPPVLGELPATGTSPRPLVQLAVLLVLLGAVACGLTGRSQPSGGRAPTRRRHV
jgi:PKD repeat protein